MVLASPPQAPRANAICERMIGSPLAYSDRTISSTPVSYLCRLFRICGSSAPSRSLGA